MRFTTDSRGEIPGQEEAVIREIITTTTILT
jgi:hypothetical protein